MDLLDPLLQGDVAPKKGSGALNKAKVKKYNEILATIWNSMFDPSLKDTHEAALEKLKAVSSEIFQPRASSTKAVIPRGKSEFRREVDPTAQQNRIPVTDYAKDKHQILMTHYFLPQDLEGNIKVKQDQLEELGAKLAEYRAKLNEPNADEALKGLIYSTKLEYNQVAKGLKMLLDQDARYEQGFENRMDGQEMALPLPRAFGSKQFTGYSQNTGMRNLQFGGIPATVWQDFGVKDRTTADEDDVLRTMEYYLEAVGGELPNPIENQLANLDPEVQEKMRAIVFANYTYGSSVGDKYEPLEGPVERPQEMPQQSTAGIESLDDLEFDELAYYMDELNFTDAPVQGTGEDGDIDLEDEENIAWMVGEINKMIQLEAS